MCYVCQIIQRIPRTSGRGLKTETLHRFTYYFSFQQRTFFTLEGHPGLQVVHLKLQPFQGAVGVPGLPLVGDQHGDDDQQQQAAAPSDADDGGQRQQAVGVDVESAGGVLEAARADLETDARPILMELHHHSRLFLFLNRSPRLV